MFTRLGRFTVRRRRAVLAATAIVFVLAGVAGSGAAAKLTEGGFEDPDAESTRAREFLEREYGTSVPNVLLLVTATRGNVDDPAVVQAGTALTEDLAAEAGVQDALSYWTLGSPPPLRSKDGSQALVVAVIPGEHGDVTETAKRISPIYTRTDDGTISVAVTGFAEIFRQVNSQVESDLVKAELVAFPITLVLLLVVYGSVVAAALPLLVGGLAIVGTLLVLWLIASVTDVSIFALNLTTGMGLGLGIDYSLFIVSRFREELRKGLAPHDAVVRTVETAGRTVAFSALTVAISLAAMLVFPLTFLRSFAYAGIAVALLAAAAATLSLPALLAVLGPRVDSFVLWKRKVPIEGTGTWHRIATSVMRRPLPIATAIILFLVALGAPFFNIEFGLPDDRVLPRDLSSRVAADQLRENFTSQEAGALQVVVPGIDTAARTDDIDDYATRLSSLNDVARVDALTGIYVQGTRLPDDQLPDELTDRFRAPDSTWLSVVPSIEPISPEGERLARAIRDLDAPFPALVAGQSAELIDSKHSLFARIPLAVTLIALSTFVLLFLMFGSIVVPLKALVINVLSLSATFGAMVYVFQEGHFSGVLNFTPTGAITATMPVLMFCVAFGLSMDYEVFLLSRIKEEHDRTGDNAASVALGLERTGRIVTAAALLISVVFLAVATSGVMFIKLFGVGLTLAVLIDAFVIRATLVPAFMRLAGEANWWAPRPLRRLHNRFGIREAEPEATLPAHREEPPNLLRAPADVH